MDGRIWQAAGRETVLHRAYLDTPLGAVWAVFSPQGLCLLEFADTPKLQAEIAALARAKRACFAEADGQDGRVDVLRAELAAYFSGSLKTFATPVEMVGTPFQCAVWRVLQSVLYGETRSYAQQAAALGNARAVRAVAAANGRNKVSLLLPCHRIIGSNGSLTGYAGGLWRKQALLELERNNVQAA